MARFSPEPLLPRTYMSGYNYFCSTPYLTSYFLGCNHARGQDGKIRSLDFCDPRLVVDIDYVSYLVFEKRNLKSIKTKKA